MSTTLALHTLRLSFQHWKSTYYLLLNGTIHISFCFYLKSHWCGQKFRPSCVFISLDKTLEGARTKAQQRKWERLTCIIYNLITLFFSLIKEMRQDPYPHGKEAVIHLYHDPCDLFWLLLDWSNAASATLDEKKRKWEIYAANISFVCILLWIPKLR